MTDALFAIGVTEAKAASEKETTIQAQMDAAMKLMQHHWMILDEDLQFRCAVGALLMIVDEQTQETIKEEMASLKALSALMSGIPVDMERVTVPQNPLGLMKRWKELKVQP